MKSKEEKKFIDENMLFSSSFSPLFLCDKIVSLAKERFFSKRYAFLDHYLEFVNKKQNRRMGSTHG